MDNKDITIVVQGPVQALPDRNQDESITRKCLNSVREHLPGAYLILSTWKDQDLDGLDYDELMICDDPGMNIVGYAQDGSPRTENTNRQIVSTVEGLRRVKTRFAAKLRSDNYLSGNGFKQLQESWTRRGEEMRFLEERVVVSNTFSRRYYRGWRVTYYVCDFFYFGLTRDLLGIWDMPHLEDVPYRPDQSGRVQHPAAPWPILDVDQMLTRQFLRANYDCDIGIEHNYDTRFDARRRSDIFFANNFVIARPDQIDLELPSKFVTNRQAKQSTQITYLSHQEWERMYRKYCDPSYQPKTPFSEVLQIWLWRCVFVPLKAIGNLYRVLRDRLRWDIARMKARR
jgi:hypothetical protein